MLLEFIDIFPTVCCLCSDCVDNFVFEIRVVNLFYRLIYRKDFFVIILFNWTMGKIDFYDCSEVVVLLGEQN